MTKTVHSQWYRITVTLYWRAPTAVLAERPAPIPLCLSQIAYEMSLYQIWGPNLLVISQTIKLRNKSAYGCNLSCRWLSLLCWPTRTDTPVSCPASSSMIRTRVHLISIAELCLQLLTPTELVVMVGCVSIAGDRSSTWWSSGTLWKVFNIV
jgi:hypothetical protein